MSSSTPQRLTMPGQVHKAYKVMLKLLHPKLIKKDQQIPIKILQRAKGVAFVTVIKAGFIWSGTVGSGIVIARLEDGTWSGPSSLGVVGMGWGGQIGASVTDSVIILNTDLAVRAFAGHGQIKFGGNLSVSAGPIGREADGSAYAGDGGVAACYSYSHSRGLFAGISLQGAVFVTRDSDNAKFYGAPVKSRDILKGTVKPPENEDLRNLVSLLTMVHEEKDAAARASVTGASSSGSFNRFSGLSIAETVDEDEDNAEDYAEQIQLEALGWSKALDATGKPYYWNAELNKTQWENPLIEAAARAPPPPPPPTSATAGDLPPGWVELPAGAGLGVYYWNQERNLTQWEKPTLVAPAAAAPPALARSGSMVKQLTPQQQPQTVAAPRSAPMPQLQQTAAAPRSAPVPQLQQQTAAAPKAAPAIPPKSAAVTAAAASKPRPTVPPRPASIRTTTSANPFESM